MHRNTIQLHDKDENAVAVSVGRGMVAATPDDKTVVVDSGMPGLSGIAGNELICPAP